jgi:hypothetical protein
MRRRKLLVALAGLAVVGRSFGAMCDRSWRAAARLRRTAIDTFRGPADRVPTCL